MICPWCRQGDVRRAKVVATGGTIYYCDEEDTLWLRPEDIGTSAKSSLGTYLNIHGLTHLGKGWSLEDEVFDP